MSNRIPAFIIIDDIRFTVISYNDESKEFRCKNYLWHISEVDKILDSENEVINEDDL